MDRRSSQAQRATLIVVAYDVRDRRRLRRVAKMMEQYGSRVQFSVFECRLDKERMARLFADIKRAINRRQDKVTVITLCQSCVHRSERFAEQGFTADMDVYVC
ncbi:MAG TPA: CRISPR-associated endonuclease Cas2 [Blastocatellia bacterium]|nr:CRISPR-associated endonuclease Cas2 [Blastocatellia bacterium]